MNAPRTALVVVAHHRADSLTAHIAAQVEQYLRSTGHRVDLLDLHREGFDPRMNVADQPDWDDRDKRYSEEVAAHQERVLAADVIVPVFPVYWLTVPAVLKGWIDRVWNYGFAYGRSKPRLAGKRMLWIGLAGATEDDPASPVMRGVMDVQLKEGTSFYCGIADAAVELLFDSEGQPQTTDGQGNLTIGAALEGEARTAHFADLERRAVEHVEKFLASA